MEFIAEIGINHSGSIKQCKRMIVASKKSGATHVKFQKRTPEDCVPENMKNVDKFFPQDIETVQNVYMHSRKMTYLQYKEQLEFWEDEYNEIDKLCSDLKIKWFSSVWDVKSVEFMMEYNVPYIKIPSALVTDKKVIKAVANTGKHVMMSTGMSTEEDVINAVQILEKNGFVNKLVLMQSKGIYPCPDEKLNLNQIDRLRELFPECEIGHSSHDKDKLSATLAYMKGVRIFERHVTFNRHLWGSDQSSSLPFPIFKQMVREIKRIPKILGEKEITIEKEEYDKIKSLRK